MKWIIYQVKTINPECLFTVEVYIENYQSVKWEEDLNLIQISDKTKPK